MTSRLALGALLPSILIASALATTGCSSQPGSTDSSSDESSWHTGILRTESGDVQIHYQMRNGIPTMEGDIDLRSDDLQAGSVGTDSFADGTRSAIFIAGRAWPGNVVPYRFDSSIVAAEQTLIQQAVAEYNTKTSLNWIADTAKTAKDYVVFKSDTSGCHSGIGHSTGENDIYLQWSGCGDIGRAAHEMAHAVGMEHEQSRTDRDSFVIIDTANIQSAQLNNFQKASGNTVGPFDFSSIMLYPSYNSFAIDGTKPTLTRLDGTTWGDTVTGQPLSAGDLAGIASLYPAHPASSANVVALEQSSGIADALTVGTDGSVKIAWESGGTVWGNYAPLSAVSFAPSGAPLAVAAQGSSQFDAFVVGNDGAIYDMLEVNNGSWASPTRLTATRIAVPGAHLATGHQGSNQLDLFFVDTQGRLNVMWVVGTSAWSAPTAISAAGFAPSGAAIATSAQGSNQLDAFVVDSSGRPNVFWAGSGAWAGPGALSGAGLAPPGAPLATGLQAGNQVDLFVVDTQGRVNVMWNGSSGTWAGPGAMTATQFAPPGANLATAIENGNSLDLFVVGNTGAVSVLWAPGTGNWQGPSAMTSAGLAQPGASVSAAGQAGNQVDLLTVGKSGLFVSWVVGAGAWSNPGLVF